VTTERPVEELSDDGVLALSELRLTDEQDEMMRLYEHGLLRKAQALKVAVQRGLREPLQA